MFTFLKAFSPFQLALLGGCFAWGVTSLGAAVVFLFRKIDRNVLNGLLGFSAGVMVAAAIWSLIIPSIDLSKELGMIPWIPPAAGIIVGMIVLFIIDKILPHLHQGLSTEHTEGIKTKWQKNILLFSAITLHNIPEGLVIGVAFGSLNYASIHMTIATAAALALGIAMQDFPEGIAASVPLRGGGWSKWKSFFYGQLSGVVEPIGALFGYWFVTMSRQILPFALAFAAGAMLFVVVEELIPESQQEGNTDISTIFTIVGFVVMMILDVALS